jgi:hypothetical protein
VVAAGLDSEPGFGLYRGLTAEGIRCEVLRPRG